MKIHFIGSLKGNKVKVGGKANYEWIVDKIEELGHQIVTRHSLGRKLTDVLKESPEENSEYVKKMMKWIRAADVIVAEVSKPELGTGYELGIALSYEKPIVTLYTKGSHSPVLLGQNSEKIQHIEYDIDDLSKTLKIALEDVADQMDVRFNFFVSPKIVSYLDWITRTKKMPRAVYLRRLIEQDIQKNKEFAKEG